MRSSTILVITLRSLAQETIKNLVLSGVGRMIVMDDKEVTEVDLGAGLLFREDDGAVGQKVSTRAGALFLDKDLDHNSLHSVSMPLFLRSNL
jgi:ubiquitin-like 1-activating enzyme E1 A